MATTAFVNELLELLNNLISDDKVCDAFERLIEIRTEVPPSLKEHPTLQVVHGRLGLLGVLNGLVGVLHHEPHEGKGVICAVYNEDGKLLRFERTSKEMRFDG